MKHDRTLSSALPHHAFRVGQLLKAIAYLRVSTGRQADVGGSINDQRAAIAEHAAANGMDMIKIYEEQASASKGTLADRPVLLKALKHCSIDGAVLIVARPDRISRSRTVLEEIFTHGVPVHVAGRGKLTRVILRKEVRVAEGEARENSARQTEAHREKNVRAGGRMQRCNIPIEARLRGSEANQARRDHNARAIAQQWFDTPSFEKLTWDKRAEALSAAGIFNEKSALEQKPWTNDALRKLWPYVSKELTTLRMPTVADVGGHVACPSTTVSIHPVAASKAPLIFSDISEARVLTNAEREWLQKMMSVHGFSQSDVMDKLGFGRLDASLWSAMRHPFRVRPDMLSALEGLAASCSV